LKIISVFLGAALSLYAGEVYFHAYGQKVLLTPLPVSRSVTNDEIKYYQTQDGKKLGVRHEVIIGCKKDTNCTKSLNAYTIKSVKQISPRLYLLKLPENLNPFDVANQLFKEKNIILAHPNFIQERIHR
jgi:hypothetical protein